ncbi:hypothetical protein TrVGV298_001269 [Trichoderma virens]|nr:hypothetical protein TrVGV298_001269 [Trichoderma virens]
MQTIKDLLPADVLSPAYMERARNFFLPLWGNQKKEDVSKSADPEEGQAVDSNIDEGHETAPTGIADSPQADADISRDRTGVTHVYIGVMGVTGAGKSSFISMCTGKEVKIGHELKSCTSDVEDVELMLNDRVCVHLIDTPGFDDTNRSDAEVLQNIAYWLSKSFKEGTKLSGMIYLHRITDIRMTGSARRNLLMFQKLCGEKVQNGSRNSLKQRIFWGYMHKMGSRIFRLAQARESCLEIIRHILSLDSTIVLELQDEIVNLGHQIKDTKAGVQLNDVIIREREKYQTELLDMRKQMQEEMVQQNAELQRVFKEECGKLEEYIRLNKEEQSKLNQDLKAVHERKEREILELRMQIGADMERKRKKHDDNPKEPNLSQKNAFERQTKEYVERKAVRAENKYVTDINEKILEVDEKIDSIDQSILSFNFPVVEGAAFNSYAEQHNPTCLPDTRVELLQRVSDWAHDPHAKAIFWLNGMAGTGKSTVSRTIAQSLASTSHLGASFFFKRGEGDRGRAARFFTTIAAQLTVMQPAIAVHIKNAIKADSDIGSKGLREQFNKLILQPLSAGSLKNENPRVIVLVIDALDECELEEDIKLIIRLLSRVKNVGLRVFVTSRPELPIRLSFSDIRGEFQHVILHEMPEPVIWHDLSVFITHNLREISVNYNKTVQEYRQLHKDWPVLEYDTKSQESKLDATYLPVLDQQVAGLSTRERNEVLQDFRYIVGSIVLLASPLSVSSLAELLGISRDVIDTRLDMLHSVLSIPPSAESPVRLLHLSFRDFLVDPEKREKREQCPWWINQTEAHGKIMDNCLRVMTEFLRQDMCNLRLLKMEDSIIDCQKAASYIPAPVQYACLNWVFHLQGAKDQAENHTEIFQFLEQHFLHWIEALSLIRKAPESIKIIRTLQALIPAIKLSLNF